MDCLPRNVLYSNLLYNIFSKINTFCNTEATLYCLQDAEAGPFGAETKLSARGQTLAIMLQFL